MLEKGQTQEPLSLSFLPGRTRDADFLCRRL
jgi:hypothetical protein